MYSITTKFILNENKITFIVYFIIFSSFYEIKSGEKGLQLLAKINRTQSRNVTFTFSHEF